MNNFFKPIQTDITLNIYFKNLNLKRDNFRIVSLSSNSSSLLSLPDTKFEENPRYSQYPLTMNVGHPLRVGNFTGSYDVIIIYNSNKTNDNRQNFTEIKIPANYNIQSLDFNQLEYFWIIAFGVLASRIFSISDIKEPSIRFGYAELIWVPFSAIITLLIFSSFITQVKLTDDIILNLALAFGFGFGFDKAFESGKMVRN